MKNAKRILCLIVVLGICFSLCGCSILDSLRASRAIITDDGTVKLYDGTEYKLLPECEALSPTFDMFIEVFIAEEDLPLLLTVFAETSLLKSDDGKFLLMTSEDGGIYYCRTDVYDSVMDRILNGFNAELCCYWSYDFENGEEVLYTLTQAQMDLVKQVCTTQQPQVLPEAAVLDAEHWADLYLCTEDWLFREDTADICIVNGKYYVVDYAEGDVLYSVPEELTAQFAEIMEKQIQSDSYWDDWE